MEEPRIVTISNLKLVGKCIETSLSEQKTVALWKSFHPHKKKIRNSTGSGLYSIQVYDEDLDFSTFTSQTTFQKWAAIEVDEFDVLPEGMKNYTLPGGKYAVFIHKGLPSDFLKTSQYIHGTWLPNSFYELDHRPHFEIMKDDYSPTDPEAEEEVWIPITSKDVGYDL